MKRIFQRRKFLKHRKPESYRPAWRFPEIIEHAIAKWVLSPSLHVCSGQSSLGDVKLDLYERADVKAAMRYLPFRLASFASIIWDPPYAMHRTSTMGTLIELRSMLQPLGRLISVHYFDPGSFLQRTMRLVWKAYYESKSLGGVRVVTILEKLPARRVKVGRMDQLIPVPIGIWEPEQLAFVSTGVGPTLTVTKGDLK